MRDVNLELGGLLLDMATLAGNSQRAWGYKRAAKAVFRLDRHVTPLIEANTFKAVPGIGPTTDRIARELIYEGKSALVEEAIRAAGKEEAIAKLRGLRQHFISRATMEEVLARRGGPSRAKYRGDFQMHSIWSDGSETLDSVVEACLDDRVERLRPIAPNRVHLEVAAILRPRRPTTPRQHLFHRRSTDEVLTQPAQFGDRLFLPGRPDRLLHQRRFPLVDQLARNPIRRRPDPGHGLEGIRFDQRRDVAVEPEDGLGGALVAPCALAVAGQRRHVEQQSAELEVHISHLRI